MPSACTVHRSHCAFSMPRLPACMPACLPACLRFFYPWGWKACDGRLSRPIRPDSPVRCVRSFVFKKIELVILAVRQRQEKRRARGRNQRQTQQEQQQQQQQQQRGAGRAGVKRNVAQRVQQSTGRRGRGGGGTEELVRCVKRGRKAGCRQLLGKKRDAIRSKQQRRAQIIARRKKARRTECRHASSTPRNRTHTPEAQQIHSAASASQPRGWDTHTWRPTR